MYKMRVDGTFVDLEKNIRQGQYVNVLRFSRVTFGLLEWCHGILHRLLLSSEPALEELLSTIKKCLNEVLEYGGSFSARDLYPHQLALHQIGSLRVDRKFPGADGTIPEGQGIVMIHLNECHELVAEGAIG
ncbi:hypothetical protein BDM02DRAFT_3215438 [Thelephora ganbajun]|uniref:Uncharacterized protein n=1 Tax=Thelephora ganbajun TaxID=370292 RepID=A0ACB6Z3P0_THEGA|nr:hypothetical protein BDM02DRAFT_3215438 [Thelephora ganbajun]